MVPWISLFSPLISVGPERRVRSSSRRAWEYSHVRTVASAVGRSTSQRVNSWNFGGSLPSLFLFFYRSLAHAPTTPFAILSQCLSYVCILPPLIRHRGWWVKVRADSETLEKDGKIMKRINAEACKGNGAKNPRGDWQITPLNRSCKFQPDRNLALRTFLVATLKQIFKYSRMPT